MIDVEIPGVGTVQFPDTMTRPQINQAASRLYGDAQAKAAQERATGPTVDGSATSRFLSGAAKNLNPITAITGIASAVRHPLDTASNIGTAQLGELKKAIDDYHAGRYSEMLGHGTAAALPVLGPAASAAGERIATGDVMGGLGEGAGLVVPFAAADAVKGAGKLTRGGVQLARQVPKGAAALDELAAMAERAGVNRLVDVAGPKVGPNKTRLNNSLAKIAPKLLRDEDLAALSRQGLQRKIEGKLSEATSALDAAAGDRPGVQTTQTQAIVDALMEKRKRLTAQAVEGSRIGPDGTSGAAGADLSTARAGADVSAGGDAGAAGGRSFRSTSEAQLFDEVLADARKNGFTGTNGELRAGLSHQVSTAKDLAAELADLHATHGPQALLQEIARYGGIGADTGYPGEIAHLWEDSNGVVVGKGTTKGGRNQRSRTLSSGAIAGVPGVLKKSGHTLDHIAEALRQDPRFQDIHGPNELLDAIHAARQSKARAPAFTEALDIVGVRPGVRWWDGETESAVQAPPPPPPRQAVPIGQDVVPGPNRERVGQIDQVLKELQQLGPVARYEPLRRIREAYDQSAKAVYSPALTADFLKRRGESLGAADVTATLRDHLAQMDPATAKANGDYSLYKSASDILKATEETERARPKVLRGVVARSGGAIAGAQSGGAVGAGLGVMVGTMVQRAAELAPTTKILVARQFAKAADLLRAGKAAKAQAVVKQTATLIQNSTKVVKRTAVPTGRLMGSGARLPMAADNQSDPPQTIGQR